MEFCVGCDAQQDPQPAATCSDTPHNPNPKLPTTTAEEIQYCRSRLPQRPHQNLTQWEQVPFDASCHTRTETFSLKKNFLPAVLNVLIVRKRKKKLSSFQYVHAKTVEVEKCGWGRGAENCWSELWITRLALVWCCVQCKWSHRCKVHTQ